MSTIRDRATSDVGLEFFEHWNHPEDAGPLDLTPPTHSQYVLRCPVIIPGQGLSVPGDMQWTLPLYFQAQWQQFIRGIKRKFCYITIRHGFIMSALDDEWHVDGFSTKIPHLPEQNYVWASTQPTEFISRPFTVPDDFDPRVHNLHHYIQDYVATNAPVVQLKPRRTYILDPYVIHRRPHIPEKLWRTFVRVSFTDIEINDRNNHVNPVFGNITPDKDGLADFRDQLDRYSNH